MSYNEEKHTNTTRDKEGSRRGRGAQREAGRIGYGAGRGRRDGRRAEMRQEVAIHWRRMERQVVVVVDGGGMEEQEGVMKGGRGRGR